MPVYQCCLLDHGGNPIRYAELRSGNDEDAHREAMALLVRTGRFAGFELWHADLRIEVYKPVAVMDSQSESLVGRPPLPEGGSMP